MKNMFDFTPVSSWVENFNESTHDSASRTRIFASFVMLPEVAESARIILDRVHRKQGRGFFITGLYGSGKIIFMAWLSAILTEPTLRKQFLDTKPEWGMDALAPRKFLTINFTAIEVPDETLEQAFWNSVTDHLRHLSPPVTATLSNTDAYLDTFFNHTASGTRNDVENWIRDNRSLSVDQLRSYDKEYQKTIIDQAVAALNIQLVQDRTTVTEKVKKLVEIAKERGYEGVLVFTDFLKRYFREREPITDEAKHFADVYPMYPFGLYCLTAITNQGGRSRGALGFVQKFIERRLQDTSDWKRIAVLDDVFNYEDLRNKIIQDDLEMAKYYGMFERFCSTARDEVLSRVPYKRWSDADQAAAKVASERLIKALIVLSMVKEELTVSKLNDALLLRWPGKESGPAGSDRETARILEKEGSLNTDIVFEDFEETIKSDEQEEIQSLWNDAKDAIGQACNLLEKILDHDIGSEKARLWISILRDPDGFNHRLQETQRQLAEYAEAAPSPKASKGHEPSGLMTLLSEKKSASQGPSFNDTRPVTSPASTPPPGDSVPVEDDSSVTYKGRTFQLYRRYTGKSVAFIEEDGELKFSIKRPVPQFLFLDQPSQAYFTPDTSAETIREQTEATNPDRQSVIRMFKLIVEETKNFQVIVTEHADIREDWYQALVRENWWDGKQKLVPVEWIEVES